MAGKNKTTAKISKEDYKRIRAKIRVKLGAYKINPDKAESYLERFKGLNIARMGEERVDSLIREEAEKSEDPSVLFELGVISESHIKWENEKAVIDAMLIFTEELKRRGKRIEEITTYDLYSTGLSKLIDSNNMYSLLKLVKPDLKPWQLSRVPDGYWDNPENVREAVEWLVEEMAKKGKKIEEITQQDFEDMGLGTLVVKYKKAELLRMVKPDLKPWQLIRVPEGYWDDLKYVKEAVEWLVEEMAKEDRSIEEITTQDFEDMGLGTLITKYKKAELLRMVKPDLKPWDLSQVSKGCCEDPKNMKEAIEWLVVEMVKKGKKIEEITTKDFIDMGLGRLLNIHKIYDLLKMVKPDLKPWQLKNVPSGYWNNREYVKGAVEWLVEEMAKKGKSIEEITTKDFIDIGFGTLIIKYKKAELLRMVKPDLKPHELNKVPNGYWEDHEHVKEKVKQFVEEMAKKGKKIEEITQQDFIDMGLGTLVVKYKKAELLRMVKPDLELREQSKVPNGYWDDPKNVKEAVERLVEEMAKKGKKIEEITNKDFIDAGLSGLLSKYRKDELLRMVKPDLKPHELNKVPNGYWEDHEHVKEEVKQFVEEMAKKGKKIEEIIAKDFIDIGLGRLLNIHKIYDLLKMVKPDLKPWDLKHVTAGYWNDPKNVKEAVEWLVNEMAKEGKKIEEITVQDFVNKGLGGLVIKYKKSELLKMIKE